MRPPETPSTEVRSHETTVVMVNSTWLWYIGPLHNLGEREQQQDIARYWAELVWPCVTYIKHIQTWSNIVAPWSLQLVSCTGPLGWKSKTRLNLVGCGILIPACTRWPVRCRWEVKIDPGQDMLGQSEEHKPSLKNAATNTNQLKGLQIQLEAPSNLK